jgi:HlyD family secretion protein
MDYARTSTRRFRWLRRGTIGVAALCALLAANRAISYWTLEGPAVDRRSIVIDKVVRGDLIHEVRGVGNLATEDVMWIPAQADGRVSRIAALPGVVVNPDMLLLELVNPELELALIDAESMLQSAQAELRTQRANLNNLLLERESELVKLQSEYDQARASHEISQALLAQRAETEHKVRLNRIKAEGLKRQLEVDHRAYEQFRDSMPDQVAIFSEKVAQADANLKRARHKIEVLQVKAGIEGVLAQVPVEVGQQVRAGDVLAKVVNPRKLKAVLKVPEVEARYVNLGQPARIDTHQGIVHGRVSRIDPAVEEGSVSVDVSFDTDLPGEARPDLSVIGMIEIERLPNVLFVGRPAAGMSESTISLLRLDVDSNVAVRVPVEIGIASISSVEIRRGLNVGDQVILSDMSRFDEFDRVRLE